MAFEYAIAILGERTGQSIILDMTIRAGVDFNAPSLSLTQLYDGMLMLYGKETTGLIIEDVILKLDEIADKQIVRKVENEK